MVARSLRSKLIIKLINWYPNDYRKAYGDEIILTAEAMLAAATTPGQRSKIMLVLLQDFCKSLIRQTMENVEQKATSRPWYIRYGSVTASVLVTPYILVCGSNCYYQLLLHRPVPIMRIETQTWMIYKVGLPIIALAVLGCSVVIRVRHTRRIRLLAGDSYDALLLGIPLTMLTAIALL